MKILIIDDDPKLRKLTNKYLSAKQHNIIEAENGAEGVALARSELPALILMDLNMPVMDGFAATREIKSIPETKNIPVVVLTAEDASSNYDAIYDAGADGYVAKPIDFKALIQRVMQYEK